MQVSVKRPRILWIIVFTDKGIIPDPKKVDAFANMKQLTTDSKVRRLLEMANYSSKFIKNYATVTEA